MARPVVEQGPQGPALVGRESPLIEGPEGRFLLPCGGEEPYVISLVTNSSTSFSKIRGQSGSTIRYPTPISVKMYSGWAGFFSIFRRIFAILTRKIWLSLFAPGPQR